MPVHAYIQSIAHKGEGEYDESSRVKDDLHSMDANPPGGNYLLEVIDTVPSRHLVCDGSVHIVLFTVTVVVDGNTFKHKFLRILRVDGRWEEDWLFHCEFGDAVFDDRLCMYSNIVRLYLR